MLSLLIFLPLLSLTTFAVLPSSLRNSLSKYIAIGTVSLQTLLLIFLATSPSISLSSQGFYTLEKTEWLLINLGGNGYLKINYLVGIDGLNLWLVALSLFLLFFASLASWHIERSHLYFALLLVFDTALIGCFLALDFFLFFLFYELLLLPMFFLIGGWGGEKRTYAAIKFFIFTIIGSLSMLVAIIALQAAVIDPIATVLKMGLASSPETVSHNLIDEIWQLLAKNKLSHPEMVHTLEYFHLIEPKNYIAQAYFSLPSIRVWGFLGIGLAFAIKLPIVPFHTWLPDAHVQAATPISVLLAGILLKVGGYGLLRWLLPIFPDVFIELQTTLAILAIISILYGAFNALAQKDLKRMIAYSSISHMGLVLLGIASATPQGFNGAVFEFVAHGFISALLFLLAGVLYNRVHSYNMSSFQGLWNKQPYYTFFIMLAFFAALGLPGFCGFIAEFLILAGALSSPALPLPLTILTVLGIIIIAGYFLKCLQTMFLGHFWSEKKEWEEKLSDLTFFEISQFYPFAILIVFLGLFPSTLLSSISPAMQNLLVDLEKAAQFWFH
ncbi:MAG: NADH-quinone oxidoreductase subunit M [Bacteroidia bacterium]|nr:NADH-quinone oxidoreductase subunit M [Bacteroidia bacterium]MDW8158483.1 NADH-quinone oxidoreductase subunit M [Bacteroidia bacterium]